MNSTFTGINIASRGLYASQVAMSVTTNNMSNANTTGYSRQEVNQTPLGVAAVYAGQSILGNGTEVTSVDQLRDTRLDQRYWQENTRLGNWETKSSALTEIESVLNPTSTSSGFSTVFNNFYSALESLDKTPGDSSTRNTVQEDGKAVCQYLNEASQELTAIREDENCAVKTTVDQINSYAGQIADLNSRISQAVAANASTNELKDQRNLLLDKLSNLTDITVTEDASDNNQMTIRVDGTTLVNGGEANELEITEDSTNDGMYSVKWGKTGDSFTTTGGQLKAELDLRDGDGTDSSYQGIPYYINQLNKFAQTFAQAFNEGTASYSGHADGYLSDGTTTGIRFFSYDDTSSADFTAEITSEGAAAAYQKITAANISLSKDIEDNVSNIAAADSSGGTDNANNVDQLIKLVKDSSMFNKGTPEDFYNSIVSTLATDSSTAQRSSTNATSLVKTINDRRTSVSGVDTNEETATMTKYQQAYEASSKMVSVWDELYAKTIAMVND
ncbi:MAG: flagellar hook-associated protein FlgK [Veillonellales bacterium]